MWQNRAASTGSAYNTLPIDKLPARMDRPHRQILDNMRPASYYLADYVPSTKTITPLSDYSGMRFPIRNEFQSIPESIPEEVSEAKVDLKRVRSTATYAMQWILSRI